MKLHYVTNGLMIVDNQSQVSVQLNTKKVFLETEGVCSSSFTEINHRDLDWKSLKGFKVQQQTQAETFAFVSDVILLFIPMIITLMGQLHSSLTQPTFETFSIKISQKVLDVMIEKQIFVCTQVLSAELECAMFQN
jgi:hypothetical protein